MKELTPKYAILAYWLFWVKGYWEIAAVIQTLWPSFFFLKAGDKTPCERCTRRKEDIISRDGEKAEKSVQTNLVKLTLIS